MYSSANFPTPTFESDMAYPPMRASTLATFELVITLPETRSPGRTVVSLTAIARICGAALGDNRGTGLAMRGAAAGGGRPEGPGVGVTTGAVAAAVPIGAAVAVATGCGARARAAPLWGDRAGFVACVPRLQLTSATKAAATSAAERSVRIA